MSARIMVMVKDASRMAKEMSVSTMDKMFHPFKSAKATKAKATVLLMIDDSQEQELEAAKEAYTFTVEAGKHRIMVTDPTKEAKQSMLKMAGTIAGGGIGFGAGNAVSTVVGGDIGKSIMGSIFNAGDGFIDCELLEGDVLKLECQPGMGGKVKIKVLK